MPEQFSTMLICNAPWLFAQLYKLIAPLLPQRTREKIKIFSSSDGAGFLKELEKHVALDQVPAFLGGVAKDPWPYAAGGDVPVGAGKDPWADY